MSKQEKVIRLKNEEERLLTEKQYKEYILRLKAHDEKSWLGTMSLTQRMRFHGMLRLLLHIDLLKKGIKVKKLNCKLPDIPDGKQVIFVLTHVGCDDIAVFSEVVREHCTILSGDYENLHNNIQGFAFALNGTVFLI